MFLPIQDLDNINAFPDLTLHLHHLYFTVYSYNILCLSTGHRKWLMNVLDLNFSSKLSKLIFSIILPTNNNFSSKLSKLIFSIILPTNNYV